MIELLVVIAIIGLLSSVVLASVNGARSKARDAKRKADLYEISNAVSAYYNQNGYLPRNLTGWCTYVSNPFGGFGQAFQSDISPAFISPVPLDPLLAGQVGDYLYENHNTTTGAYTLCAILEQPTGQTYDFSGCTGGTVYNYCVAH